MLRLCHSEIHAADFRSCTEHQDFTLNPSHLRTTSCDVTRSYFNHSFRICSVWALANRIKEFQHMVKRVISRIQGVTTCFKKSDKNLYYFASGVACTNLTSSHNHYSKTFGQGDLLSVGWPYFLLAKASKPNKIHGHKGPKRCGHNFCSLYQRLLHVYENIL